MIAAIGRHRSLESYVAGTEVAVSVVDSPVTQSPPAVGSESDSGLYRLPGPIRLGRDGVLTPPDLMTASQKRPAELALTAHATFGIRTSPAPT